MKPELPKDLYDLDDLRYRINWRDSDDLDRLPGYVMDLIDHVYALTERVRELEAKAGEQK